MKTSLIALAISLQFTCISAGLLENRDYWPVCSWPGYNTTQAFLSTTDSIYATCADACFAQPACKSFSYATGGCSLYNDTVQAVINWNSDSPYVFWDRNCESKFKSCKTKAYQAHTESYFWTDRWSADQCADACVADKNCKSFATADVGAPLECYLYNVPTKFNMDGPGDYLFSDVACAGRDDTAALAVSATTTTTTTTTKIAPITTTTALTTTRATTTTTTTTTKMTTTTTKTTTQAATTTTKPASSTKPTLTTTAAKTTTSAAVCIPYF